ncbi:MAG: CSLREA domain-containing protein [Acidimicrobiales bacterium]|nr:CSLREA domain-containing protein [Acidimicrobiales bacterium]
MRARTRRLVGIGAAAAATMATVTVGVTLTPHLASAGAPATINVDTTDDEVNEDGDCSLREAIISSNENISVDDCEKGEDADIVVVPAGIYVLSIPDDADGDDKDRGDLDIYDDVTVRGAGAATTTIDANGISRVFEIRSGLTVEMEGLTITGGDVDQEIDDESNDGGGIESDGALTLRDTVVTGNKAGFSGGGIESDGESSSLRLERTVVSDNAAAYSGGGIRQDNDYTSVTIIDSTISGNTAALGGGIHIDNTSEVSIDGSTISGNTANGDLENLPRFRGKAECGSGGGFHQDDSQSDGTTIVNSTISGNSATCGGGGIHVVGGGDFTNVTVTDNSSPDGGNVAALPSEDDVVATFTNSIVAQPLVGPDCLGIEGSIVSNGGNIDSDDTCGFGEASDQTVADVMLGALGDNGGATQTHVPQAGSAAIDAALDEPCPDDDQRGTVRPQDGDDDGTAMCDVGAVEVVFTPEETPTSEPEDDVESTNETQTPAPAAQPTVARPSCTG